VVGVVGAAAAAWGGVGGWGGAVAGGLWARRVHYAPGSH